MTALPMCSEQQALVSSTQSHARLRSQKLLLWLRTCTLLAPGHCSLQLAALLGLPSSRRALAMI